MPLSGKKSGQDLWKWAMLVILGFLVCYPLLMMVISSLSDGVPGKSGDMTLAHWKLVVMDGRTWEVTWTTLVITIPRVLLCLSVAVFFAWAITRTDLPCAKAFERGLVIMFFIPNLPAILAWTIMASPRSGVLNQWLRPIFGKDFTLNVFSYEGLIITSAMNTVPVLYLLIAPAFRNMNARLEEAASVHGAGKWTTLRTITVPLMLPALLGTAVWTFVLFMESFDFEQLIGIPAGIFVLSTEIYGYIRTDNPNFSAASVLSVLLTSMVVVLAFVQRAFIGERSYQTVSGKDYSAKRIPLGAFRWVVAALILAYFLVFGALPLAVLLVSTLMKVYGFYSIDLLTLDNWRVAFSRPEVINSIRNTILLGVIVATSGVLIAWTTNYVSIRTRWRGRGVLDMITWLPMAAPALVMGLAYIWGYVSSPLYGTVWILFLALAIRTIPTAARFLAPGMHQVSKELEEASRLSGAGPTRTVVSVLVPILRPAIMTAWLFIFVASIRMLEIPLMLTRPGSEVLSMSIYTEAVSGSGARAGVLALVQTTICLTAYVLFELVEKISKRSAAR